jgi:hypothetical protein
MRNMGKTTLFLLVCPLVLLSLTACGGGVVEGGYSPPGIPIRISLNSNGEINLGVSDSVTTPYGTFDLGYGGSVYSLRDQYTARLLIVRVDDQATVYELEEGKEFHVEFDDNNKLYRRVALNYESDGDIVLELESVQGQNTTSGGSENASSGNPSSTITSCSGAPKQRLKVGGNASVCTTSEPVALRDGPGKGYSVIKYLVSGADLKVKDGPVCANNWSYWKVQTESGYIGWMSEGGDSKDTYFLCPK